MSRWFKKEIYENVRNDIISGKLLPGVRLTETALAKKFSCSRAPVREALNQLCQDGFLTLNPNQGAVINTTSPSELEDFYSLLMMLEGRAVELAVPNLTSKDLSELSDLNRSMKEISLKDEGYVEKWIDKNLPFHKLFRVRCGNSKMDWLIEQVRARITRYRYISVMASVFEAYTKDHDEIISAARLKDSTGARKAMEKHVERAKSILLDRFSGLPSI